MPNYILLPNGDFVSQDELYHWGIKGMKWGVRRYQNADGTLTAAGKERLSKSIAKKPYPTKFTDSIVEVKNYKQNSKSYKDAVEKTKDFEKSYKQYQNDKSRWNMEANKKATEKYGNFTELLFSGDSKKLGEYLQFGKDYIKEKSSKPASIVNKKYEDAVKAAKKAEKESNKFVDDFLGEYGKMEVSDERLVSVNLETGKTKRQTVGDIAKISMTDEYRRIYGE